MFWGVLPPEAENFWTFHPCFCIFQLKTLHFQRYRKFSLGTENFPWVQLISEFSCTQRKNYSLGTHPKKKHWARPFFMDSKTITKRVRAADIHALEHIQSSASTLKKQKKLEQICRGTFFSYSRYHSTITLRIDFEKNLL